MGRKKIMKIKGGRVPVGISAVTLLQMAKEAYDYVKGGEASRSIDGWDLVEESFLLLLYKKADDYILAVRGSYEFRDVQGWTPVTSSSVANTARYKDDLMTVKKWKQRFVGDWYGTGHSLAGSICDNLIDEGLLIEAVTFNPSIEPKFYTLKQNKRIYFEHDLLYTMFGVHDPNCVLISDSEPSWLKWIADNPYYLGVAGFVTTLYVANNAHALDNFDKEVKDEMLD